MTSTAPDYQHAVVALLASRPRASGFYGEMTRDDIERLLNTLSEAGFILVPPPLKARAVSPAEHAEIRAERAAANAKSERGL